VLCRLNSNSRITRMYFTLMLHEVSPCPCPCPYRCLEGRVLVLVLGGSVLVNITAQFKFRINIGSFSYVSKDSTLGISGDLL